MAEQTTSYDDLFEEDVPTREMECPRTEIGDRTVRWEDGAYRLNGDDVPFTLLDKHQRPHERRFPTQEELDEIHNRVWALRGGTRAKVREKILDKLK